MSSIHDTEQSTFQVELQNHPERSPMKLFHQFTKLYTQEIRHITYETKGTVSFVAKAFRRAFLLSARSFAKITLAAVFICTPVFIFDLFHEADLMFISLGVVTVLFSMAYAKNLIKALSVSKYSYSYRRD